jgi:hypothetical protein
MAKTIKAFHKGTQTDGNFCHKAFYNLEVGECLAERGLDIDPRLRKRDRNFKRVIAYFEDNGDLIPSITRMGGALYMFLHSLSTNHNNRYTNLSQREKVQLNEMGFVRKEDEQRDLSLTRPWRHQVLVDLRHEHVMLPEQALMDDWERAIVPLPEPTDPNFQLKKSLSSFSRHILESELHHEHITRRNKNDAISCSFSSTILVCTFNSFLIYSFDDVGVLSVNGHVFISWTGLTAININSFDTNLVDIFVNPVHLLSRSLNL